MVDRLACLLFGPRCPLCDKRERDLYPHLAGTHGLRPSQKDAMVPAGWRSSPEPLSSSRRGRTP